MLLNLTNTLTSKLELFIPIDNKNIRIYVCGPTVYDDPHIGNGRALVIYDVLYRILAGIYSEKHVVYVRNITDIDDKIIERAKQLNVLTSELTKNVIKSFKEDTNYLRCLAPTHEPKATETLTEIINITQRLIDNGSAYFRNGHVYFKARSYKDYGKLAGKDLGQLLSGARIEIDKNKEDPIDFVLWKPAKKEDGENSYDSPWGKGRPGWHIECSAMSHKFLGEDFDIHGGGADLMFPHHTNEIAQSCSAFSGSCFAKYWVHNGFLTANGEKMSKSLGNFVTIKDLREQKIKGEIVRLMLLSSHYRSPLDYNDKVLYDATIAMDYLYRTLELAGSALKEPLNFQELPDEFTKTLLDDLNIHEAFVYLTSLAKKINFSTENRGELLHILYSCGKAIGFFNESISSWFGRDNENAQKIEELIHLRKEAKESKNWAEADRIRAKLSDLQVVIEDHSDDSTSWRMEYIKMVQKTQL